MHRPGATACTTVSMVFSTARISRLTVPDRHINLSAARENRPFIFYSHDTFVIKQDSFPFGSPKNAEIFIIDCVELASLLTDCESIRGMKVPGVEGLMVEGPRRLKLPFWRMKESRNRIHIRPQPDLPNSSLSKPLLRPWSYIIELWWMFRIRQLDDINLDRS